MKKSLLQVVGDMQELINTKPKNINEASNDELNIFINNYNKYQEVGQNKDGEPIYEDIKQTFNKLIKPVKEAMKVLEGAMIEAEHNAEDAQLSIFDMIAET